MTEQKPCTQCAKVKPLKDFGVDKRMKDGRKSSCNTCKAEKMRELRTDLDKEAHNAEMAAYRAGMRKDKCALCATPIEGYGICTRCEGAVVVLGGLDGLKRAVKAVRYLESQQ